MRAERPGTTRAAPRAQVASTIIAAVGFNGYPYPPEHNDNCQYCDLSTGSPHPIFSRQAPLYGTESVYTDSTIGCLCGPAARPGAPPAGPGGTAAAAPQQHAAAAGALTGRRAPVAKVMGVCTFLGVTCGWLVARTARAGSRPEPERLDHVPSSGRRWSL
jgi:hypothetical protein